MHAFLFTIFIFISLSLNISGLDPRHTNLTDYNVTEHFDVEIPSSPAEGRQTVDAAFQSYSIEFSYMLDYAGNFSNPNTFSVQMIQNLYEISGAYPIFRIGGATQNLAIWNPNQTVALIESFAFTGADQPDNLTIGPPFLECFQIFPDGTRYIFGLSFMNGTSGLEQTLLEANATFRNLRESIYAYEIGNEVDGFHGKYRPANYTVAEYVSQWLYTAGIINDEVFDTTPNTSNVEPLFQAGAFSPPTAVDNDSLWNAQSIIDLEIQRYGEVKTISEHEYMGPAQDCASPGQIITLDNTILNHTHTTSMVWPDAYLSNYSVAHGIPYVIGETNSLYCQGQHLISDVFGASLWSIDYALYVATLNISRLHFHMGTPYRYSPWQPVAVNNTPAHPMALYYGNLFVATALAGGDKLVEPLVNDTYFTGYAIYQHHDEGNCSSSGSTSETTTPRLKEIVLVNLNPYNSSSTTQGGVSQRPATQISLQLPKFNTGGTTTPMTPKLRRLTAPGATANETDIFWAGRQVAMDGTIVGAERVEDVGGEEEQGESSGGEVATLTLEVVVADCEAVLISF